MVKTATLHYIHDPLCGWCYGAAPLVKAAREVLPVVAHAGGMMAGSRRQKVNPQLREFVMPHDRRIAQLTGQVFGEAYVDGLLRDTSATFDSEPPIAAMLAAERTAGRGLDMLARLQTAHYVEGRRIADREVLVELAASIGLDQVAFEHALGEVQGHLVQAHMEQTRGLMSRVSAQGFPTFALEISARIDRIDAAGFLGNPTAFASWLSTKIASSNP
ncbi:DsbA family protein [Piscinibacter terrae]|uniref:DsbA family protein n=1 Tax=Piscinibacter terrae TaxID=2496871 RepID=A0A3N7HPV3_9BURK|nr:DsbA family protein [Albitalea terrae]RQP22781.1 DsbA family protein [Albitalea terrae]